MDQVFFKDGESLTTNDCYWDFVRGLASHFASTLFLARVHPEPGRGPYACLPADGFEARELPWTSDLKSIRELLIALPRTLRVAWKAVGDADIVRMEIPHPWAPFVCCFALLRGRPLVLFDRQDGLSRTRHRTSGFKQRVALAATHALQWIDGVIARRAITICGDSAIAERYRRRGIPAHVVLESVVSEETVARHGPREILPGHAPRLLWIGRLEADKGLDLLLHALARSVPAHVTLDVAGRGSDDTPLRQRARALGLDERVRFHGYVPYGPGLERMYRNATLYVHAGREAEGFPKTILEAFAHGVPVVAHRTAGIANELRDEIHALLVDPQDPAALGRAIERVLADPDLYRQLSTTGHAFARERTLERQTRQVAELIAATHGH